MNAIAAPSLAPTEASVRGNAAQGDQPPARVLERPVVARMELKPAATAAVVKVVAETKVAPPTQRLPSERAQ